jgi:XTP/dITP diphosphohydrolase
VIDIVVATHNPNKINEITTILRGIRANFLSLGDVPLPDETEVTLEANAILKADFGFKATNKISLSDDSGLEVYSLNGMPGIYSARFAVIEGNYSRWGGISASLQKANRNKLLQLLSSRHMEERKAKFRCIVAIAGIDGCETRTFEGALDGYITYNEIGNNGFGYDSVFLVPELNKTLAELPAEVKNKISHRAIALLKLRDYLKAELKV